MLIRILFLLLLFSQPCFAQLETNHWFFHGSHITVNPNGVTTGLPWGNSLLSPQNNSASISDSSGNLLFASDGNIIIDKNLEKMPALENVELYGRGGKIMIQQVPGSDTYFLFYTTNNYTSTNGNSSRTLKYAIVDMALNNGNGDVVTFDHIIDTSISEAFTIAAGADHSNFWLITHRLSTDSFFVYPITSAGLDATAVMSRAGSNGEIRDYIFRDLKTSHNGKMIAGLAYRNYSDIFATTFSFIEVFHFDATSGKLTERVRSPRRVGYFYTYMSVDFSADNRLLYESKNTRVYGLQPCGYGSGNITQYNLCYDDSLDFAKYAFPIANKFSFCSPSSSWGNIQMGADKRIYMPYSGTDVSTIDFPNRIGSYSGYTFSSFNVTKLNNGIVTTPQFTHHLLEKAIKNNIVYDGGCYPDPINFHITNDTITNVHWNFGDESGSANTSTNAAPSHVFSAPGIYTVTAQLYNSKNQWIETISELVEIKNPEQRILFEYPVDTSFCRGNTLKIKLSVVNGLYRWYKISNEGEEYNSMVSDSITIDETGKWYVELRQNDCNGCTMLDSIDVTVLPRPYVNLGPDRNFCAGDSLSLEYYDTDADIIWSTGETSFEISIHESGTYWLQAEYNQNGCISRDTINVTKRPAVQFSLPMDTTLCEGQSLTLSPGFSNAFYEWQNGSNQTSLFVTEPGLYWVKITSAYGCSKTDSINVNYISTQGVNLGNDTTLCKGEAIILHAGVANALYRWSTGELTPSIRITQTGKYWVKVQNGSCAVADTIDIQFNSPPSLWLGNDSTLCVGATIIIPGVAGAKHKWQDGSAEYQYTVSRPGLYWVEVQNDACTVRDSIQIHFFPESSISIGADVRFCEGDSLTIRAPSGFHDYYWTTGIKGPAISLNQKGRYIVEAADENGCTVKDSIEVLPPYAKPVIDLGADRSLCADDQLLLQPGNEFSQYFWSTGSTMNSILANRAGAYWVEVTDHRGCTGSDTLYITAINPSPSGFLGKDTTICSYGNLEIAPLKSFSKYIWSNGSTASAIIVSRPGMYRLQVIDQYGCSGADSISVKLIDCMKGLYIPNAFSPNNDGNNDLFKPLIFGDVEYFKFDIYNRFGELVFSTADPSKGWDGKIKGEPQNIGNYVWYCKYKFHNEEAKNEKGSCQLLR